MRPEPRTRYDAMPRHRLLHEVSVYRLPQPPAPRLEPSAFALCPFGLLPGQSAQLWLMQQWIYRQALEQAVAAHRPSLPERDLLGVWN
jgi:hypothetical protein